MTLTIGRCTFTAEPHGVSHSGNQLTIQVPIGSATSVSSDAYNAMRQQVLGLVDNADEPVVPVTWTLDSQYDGFYRVTSVSVDVGQLVFQNRYSRDCSITLERLIGYAAPEFEITTQSVVRTNVHAITTPSCVVGVFQTPSSTNAYQYDLGSLRSSTTTTTATVDTGDTITIFKANAPTTTTSWTFAVAPAKFYVGACRVEVRRSGTWYTVTGRSVDITAGTVWRISNGLVRVTSFDGSTHGTFEVWDQTASGGVGAWESTSIQHVYVPTSGINAGNTVAGGKVGATPNQGYAGPIAILRNAPEQVTVRVRGINEMVTWSLQRGAYNAMCTFNSANPGGASGIQGVGLAFATNTACTAFTGGIWQTSADANGNGLTFSNPSSNAFVSTANGQLATTLTGTMAVGSNLGATNSTVAALRRDEFFGAVSWRQQVIIR